MKDIVHRLKFWIDNGGLFKDGLVNQAAKEITRLRIENAIMKRTQKFSDREYLANHGGSYGKCKYKAISKKLFKLLIAWRRYEGNNVDLDTCLETDEIIIELENI